jgi:nicotinamide mononucleotide adenylyltransferase
MIDYSKPTAQMLGRWQPFHDGHLELFKKILEKTGQVCIMVRTMPKSENNPFEFEDIKKQIKEKLKDYVGKFEIIKVPNITNICYGRDVGYKIEEIVLPKEIQKISATKIRQKIKDNILI